MIALLFASALAQISTLNGNQVGGISDVGSSSNQAAAAANARSTSTISAPPPPGATPVTTPSQVSANLVSKVNPVPFPGNIPLPPPSGNCDVNSQTLVKAVAAVQSACAVDCSSSCPTTVKAFQNAVFECVALPEAQRKVYIDQLQIKISTQEAYCAGLGSTSTTSTAGTTGPAMTSTSTSSTATMTRTGRPNAASLDGPALWLLTLLFI